ncbi:hypothetical protein FF38_03487, partial [Lucilia cuprina]
TKFPLLNYISNNSFKITATTNQNEPSSVGLGYLGLLPCSCQCWNGPKAPKIPNLYSQVRNNAAPYILNTSNATSGVSRSCVQCKIKMDQEKQKMHLRQQQLTTQLNCSHQQQQHHHCHCPGNHVNQNVNVPPLMTFPVPPPPLPSAVPTFLPTTPQITTSAPTMSTNNQMYFVPFNMPSIMTGTAAPITTNQMPLANNTCPHHPPIHPPLANKTTPTKPLNNGPTRNVPSLRSTAAAVVSSGRESTYNSRMYSTH